MRYSTYLSVMHDTMSSARTRRSFSYAWVMAHMNRSRMNESWHTWCDELSNNTLQLLIRNCHVWMRYGTHKSVTHDVMSSRRSFSYVWVMAHMNRSRLNESCHIWGYELSNNTPHVLIRKESCTNALWHTQIGHACYHELIKNTPPFQLSGGQPRVTLRPVKL